MWCRPGAAPRGPDLASPTGDGASLDGVVLPFEADAERLVELGLRIRRRLLRLRRLLLLLLLLLLRRLLLRGGVRLGLVGNSLHCSGRCADRRALSRVAGDGADGRARSGAPRGPPHGSAFLWRRWLSSRWRRLRLGLRGRWGERIDPTRLLRPLVAVELVLVLRFLGLLLRRKDVEAPLLRERLLRRSRRRCLGQHGVLGERLERKGQHGRQGENETVHGCFSSAQPISGQGRWSLLTLGRTPPQRQGATRARRETARGARPL